MAMKKVKMSERILAEPSKIQKKSDENAAASYLYVNCMFLFKICV